jgi:hypothetical protein
MKTTRNPPRTGRRKCSTNLPKDVIVFGVHVLVPLTRLRVSVEDSMHALTAQSCGQWHDSECARSVPPAIAKPTLRKDN